MKQTLVVSLLALVAHAKLYSQDLRGVWTAEEGDILHVKWDNSFERTVNGVTEAVGIITWEDGMLKVKRTDINDEYELEYFQGTETFVITKPRSDRAWLFTRRK